MKKYTYIIIWVLAISHSVAFSQTVKPFSATFSIAPTYYFNNIRVFKENIQPFNYAGFLRAMWHSKYALSLGIEIGYHQFYKADKFSSSNEISASLTAIPIHLVTSIHIVDNFYTNIGIGPSILKNKVIDKNSTIKNTITSIADFHVAIGYLRQLTSRLSIGAEIKYNFSSKNTDSDLALPITCAYRF